NNISEAPMMLGQAVGSNCEVPIALGKTPQVSGIGDEALIMLDAACEVPPLLGKTRLAIGTFDSDNSGNVVDDLARSGVTSQS
ncbi:unnamed protein product, partial [Ilex paraguariensis]